MKQRILPALGMLCLGGVIGVWLGVSFGLVEARKRTDTLTHSLVAVGWGDGTHGKAFYGAYVVLAPLEAGYSVRAFVSIARGNGMFHECGELGRVATTEEAVAKWGKIDWQDDGLHIGTGTNAYFLPRAKLESHR
jgi:hypothetical protein